jgi:hypothetical protein
MGVPLRLLIVRLFHLLSLALLASSGSGQASHQPPVLTTFAIDNGAENARAHTTLLMAHTVAGAAPTDYRISSRADFEGAPWIAYDPRPTTDSRHWRASGRCQSPGFSRLLLFLQVRRRAGEDVRIVAGKRTLTPVWLESNVLADSICIASAP